MKNISRIIVVWAACVCLCSCASKSARRTWDINQPVRASFARGETPYDGRVQVIAYNIERGFFWDDVASYIAAQKEEVPATVVLLSEADRSHSRTGEVFVAKELAENLDMDMVFVTEYIEYNDETAENQGDHGNAILSSFPLSDVTVIRHTTVYSWQMFGWVWGQPRYGERVTIGATIELPDGKELRVYTAHLESNADTIGKWIQMREILRDAQKYHVPAVIGGDFNELPFGLMFKLLPRYGFDNAFSGDKSPTGSCKPAGDHAACTLKIDWIVHRGIATAERSVDYPLNSEGNVISDHAPVRAVFEME